VGDPVPGPPDLDVNPRLGELSVALRQRCRCRATGRVEFARYVTADAQHGVHDQVDVRAVPVQLHRHGIDEVRHVVGHDVDHGPGAVQRRGAGVTDADQGTALRAASTEPGVLVSDGGGPLRAGRRQVFAGDMPVIGSQEPEDIGDRFPVDWLRPPGSGRPREQRVPNIVGAFRHLLSTPLCTNRRVHHWGLNSECSSGAAPLHAPKMPHSGDLPVTLCYKRLSSADSHPTGLVIS